MLLLPLLNSVVVVAVVAVSCCCHTPRSFGALEESPVGCNANVHGVPLSCLLPLSSLIVLVVVVVGGGVGFVGGC